MSNTRERKKQRRQYLKRKGWAYTKMSLNALLVVPLAFLAVFALAVNIYLSGAEGSVAGGFIVFLGLGFLAWWCARSVRKARQEAMQLPYIPPVTANTLPAEDVLVRGSEEPAQQQSKVLLRGTDSGQESGEQELLRGIQGNPVEARPVGRTMKRARSWIGWLALIAVGLCFAAMFSGLMYSLFYHLMPWTGDRWHPADFAQAEALLSASLAKPLRPGEQRIVPLPANSPLSAGNLLRPGENNDIYLCCKPDGLVLAFFVTYVDVGILRGYVYCSRPLLPSDMEWDYNNQERLSLEETSPRGTPGAWKLPITRKVNAHWYYVDWESIT